MSIEFDKQGCKVKGSDVINTMLSKVGISWQNVANKCDFEHSTKCKICSKMPIDCCMYAKK